METFSTLVEANFTKKNWRITIAVRAVIQILENNEKLLSVIEITNALTLAKHKVNASTVYRILEKLTQINLIHEFEGQWKRCTCPTNHLDEHHFLICTKCQRVEEIFLDYKEAIAEQLFIEKQFQLKHVHLGFWGECKRCQM